MRMIFSLIGYVSTGTVLALLIGVGYLWQSDVLSDDKMFRMAAVFHDVDWDAITAEQSPAEQKIPTEEISINEVDRMREVKLRNYEVKQNALKMAREEFDYSFRQISEATARFDKHAKEIENRLQQQGELSTKENMTAVVNHLQVIKPKEAKELLFMFLEEQGGEKDVILLLKAMQNSKRKKVLQQFKTPDELEKLHRIQRLMLAGYPEKQVIDAMLEQVRLPNGEP